MTTQLFIRFSPISSYLSLVLAALSSGSNMNVSDQLTYSQRHRLALVRDIVEEKNRAHEAPSPNSHSS